ncbi:MAG: AIPR family protein [Pirellulaceae bacterium]
MGVIQIRHITNALHKQFNGLVDVADHTDKSPSAQESTFLTRSLAAYSVAIAADVDSTTAAKAVVDEYKDNGIDAIHYGDKETTLYIVQTKWHASGNGTISAGDMHKFIQGVRDLVNGEFSRFGPKLRDKEAAISTALDTTSLRVVLLVVHTGLGPLAVPVRQIYDDLATELNDASDVLNLRVLTQKEIHDAVSENVLSASIRLEVMLHEWGTTRSPYPSYYGQVVATDVAQWWDTHGPTLFEKNLRKFVGSTEVNDGIIDTLLSSPDKFWYFNNGITVLCTNLVKKTLGGNKRTTGVFVCDGVSIVNGAQTVGCIGEAFKKNPDQVQRARVNIRFISLGNSPEDFPIQLTRAANTQNRIERRDFAALDPEQDRLRRDLWMEYEKQYVFKTGDPAPLADEGCGIEEATVALACAEGSLALATQSKREVGKLWEDINRPPYKLLFNASITASRLWRCVEILRAVESILKKKQAKLEGRERMVAVHGNRLILHLVFKSLPVDRFDDLSFDSAKAQKRAARLATSTLKEVIIAVTDKFPNAYLNSLFKNQSKCEEVISAIHRVAIPLTRKN